MTEAVMDIWKPVGPQPSSLHANETANFNSVFTALYEHFESNDSLSYVTHEYRPNEWSIFHQTGFFTVGRVSKWLVYYNLLQWEKVKEMRQDPYDADKEKLRTVNYLKPTVLGKKAFENGQIITINSGYYSEKGVEVGIGKPYPTWMETEKWLDEQYAALKVAQWRQAKWHGDARSEYVLKAAKSRRDKAEEIMRAFLAVKVAAIPSRRRKAIVKTVGDPGTAKLESFI